MVNIIKPLNVEISVSNTSNTIYGSRLVRIHADTGSPTITVRAANGAMIGTFGMEPNTIEYLEKEPTDRVEASVATGMTPVAYKG